MCRCSRGAPLRRPFLRLLRLELFTKKRKTLFVKMVLATANRSAIAE
jgi:hypothetical protein